MLDEFNLLQKELPFYGPLYCVQDYTGKLVPETQNQEGKTNLDLLKQEIVSGSCISWVICKSAPRSRQNNHASIPPPTERTARGSRWSTVPKCNVLFTAVTLKQIQRLETYLLIIKQANNTNEALSFQCIIAAWLYQSLSTYQSTHSSTQPTKEIIIICKFYAFSALTLLVGRQKCIRKPS